MTINVLNLFTPETATKILSRGLAVAKAVGLPVGSWRTGDPTRSLYAYLADAVSALEPQGAEFAKSGFMSTAEGDWATLRAKEVYGVDRGEATYAKPTVTLRNAGGGVFSDLGNGGLTVRSSRTKKTFHSTNDPGVLGPETELTFELIADEAGAASSVGEDDLDDFVTPAQLGVFGVEIVGSTAAAAQDQQPVDELRDQCGDTLGALSPNGPPDAYEYVCKNPKLTGVTEINRAQTQGDDDRGRVLVYVASATGPVSAASVAKAQAAIDTWATPKGFRPTVVSAVAAPVDVTAVVSGASLDADAQAAISRELGALFSSLPIGGIVYRSKLIAAIHGAVPGIASVNLIAPALDVVVDSVEVPTLGLINVT